MLRQGQSLAMAITAGTSMAELCGELPARPAKVICTGIEGSTHTGRGTHVPGTLCKLLLHLVPAGGGEVRLEVRRYHSSPETPCTRNCTLESVHHDPGIHFLKNKGWDRTKGAFEGWIWPEVACVPLFSLFPSQGKASFAKIPANSAQLGFATRAELAMSGCPALPSIPLWGLKCQNHQLWPGGSCFSPADAHRPTKQVPLC